MACPLFDAEPITEPMLPYYQLDTSDLVNLVKFESKYNN